MYREICQLQMRQHILKDILLTLPTANIFHNVFSKVNHAAQYP